MEQVGEPFEIYNNPSTGFVASFVGQLNRLPVTVVDPPSAAFGLAVARSARHHSSSRRRAPRYP